MPETGLGRHVADIESTLLAHLEVLYGPESEWVLDDLLRLMQSFEGRLEDRPRRQLGEKDAVLITYGDMVHEAGRPPLGALGDFLAEHVADIVNTVHILPFFPYSSDDGFAVIDYRTVDPVLGTWDDVAAIGRSFRLMFDAVVNHVSARSESFERFREDDPRYRDFFTVVEPGTDTSSVFRPRAQPLLTEVETSSGPRLVWTTFGPDQIDLNYANPTVLLAVVDVLLSYIAHGASTIRLDAIAFIWKELGTSCIHLAETHRIIQLLRAVIEHVAPHVSIITETNVPHAENVSYFGDGTNEAHLVYNFALPPLTLHAFHTGDASELSAWAADLEAPAPGTAFLNFLASHDGIGVGGARGLLADDDIERMGARTQEQGGHVSYRDRPDGRRVVYELNINFLDALEDPASAGEGVALTAQRFLTSQAIMLALQGVPAIYFHSLVGSRGWPEGVAERGTPRTINREKLDRVALESKLTDAGTLRHAVFHGYRELLLQRRAHPAFSPDADQQVITIDPRVFGLVRSPRVAGESVLCLHNVSSQPCSTAVDLAGLAEGMGGELRDLLSDERYVPANGRLTIELGPFQTVWLAGRMEG